MSLPLRSITVIDLDTSQPYIAVVHGKQYDTVRMVEAHLFFSGSKWYVPSDNIYSVISYKKSDNIGGFYDITENGTIAVAVDADDRSIIYLALDAQMMRVPGETKTDVTFYDTITKGRLGLFRFIVDVEAASVRELDLRSEPYFSVLAEDIKAVLDAEEKITGLTATASQLAPDEQPTVVVSGGTGAGDPYLLEFGIPSMPGVTASTTRVAPGTNPNVTLSGGTAPGEDYNFAFDIPTMPGVTVTGSKLAPDVNPIVQISGGTTATEPYNIAFGIPSMPGITASASQIGSADSPTATVTGGTQPGEDYNIAFGIPKGVGITSIVNSYGVSMDEDVLPTSWVDRLEDLHVPDGSFQWTKVTVNCDNNQTYTNYSKCAQGYPGPPGVAVQDFQPETTTLIWVNPDEDQRMVIPEYTADEDAMIHSFSGVILSTVRTIPT